METRQIVIRSGTVTGFADEVRFDGLKVVDVKKRRVSRILPVGKIPRAVFVLIRAMVGNDSRVAAWTRRWPCRWNVWIGSERFGPFESRSDAIAFEKGEINGRGELERASSNINGVGF